MADQTIYVDSNQTNATGYAGSSADPYSLTQFINDYTPSIGDGDIDTVYFRGTFVEAANAGVPDCPFANSGTDIMSTTRTDNTAMSRFIGVSSTGAGGGGDWTVDYADPAVFQADTSAPTSIFYLALSNTIFENCKFIGKTGVLEADAGLKLVTGSGMGAYRCDFPELMAIAVDIAAEGCIVANCTIGVGATARTRRPGIGVAANATGSVAVGIVNNTVEVNAGGEPSGAGVAINNGGGIVVGNRIMADGSGLARSCVSVLANDGSSIRGSVVIAHNSLFGERGSQTSNGITVQAQSVTPHEACGRVLVFNNIFQDCLNAFIVSGLNNASVFAVTNYGYDVTNDVAGGDKTGYVEALTALTNEPFTGIDETSLTQDWTCEQEVVAEINTAGGIDSIFSIGAAPGARLLTHDLFRRAYPLRGLEIGS